VKNEKQVLSIINCPFVSKLYHSFQDEDHLYLLLEYVHGGELYTRLKNEVKLPEPDVKFYA
jgi:serine/threonine protein kinase